MKLPKKVVKKLSCCYYGIANGTRRKQKRKLRNDKQSNDISKTSASSFPKSTSVPSVLP